MMTVSNMLSSAGLMGPEWRTKYIVAATVEFPAKHPPVSTVAVPRSCPESLTKPKANEAAWRKKWHFLFSTYCLLFIVRHGEAVPSTAAATSTPSSCGRGSLLFWELCCPVSLWLRARAQGLGRLRHSSLSSLVEQDPKRSQWLRTARLHRCWLHSKLQVLAWAC